ncbi:hypothetical protein AABB24_021910 [Solanum stoloniferum]|uniref:DUS-like FMN-binding domain-containing protein n=1 Tax=Solanum stoloniferum TaxID=62892 RepID=A0ABD2SXC2_9SOLN
MLAAETIVYQAGNLDRFLAYGPEQHHIVLQIGGNNLKNLAKATQLAIPYGYDENNFNCGCLNPRVAGHGCFGVRLMLDLRKICFCPDGFPKGKNEFFSDVTKLEEFLKDPWGLKAKQPATIQVKVPKLNVAPPPQAPVGDGGGGSSGDGEEAAAIASAKTKRVALQKKTAAASMVADDFARQFESGDVEVRNRSSKKWIYKRCWWRRTGSIECQSDVQAMLFQ